MSNVNDQAYLKHEQYQESRNLDTRIDLHERFTIGQQNWYRWTFDHLALPPQARVLELGCGSGILWQCNLDRLSSKWLVHLSDFDVAILYRTH